MRDKKQELSGLYSSLGYKPLNRVWAKVEILLGLGAAGAGLLLAEWGLLRPSSEVNLGWAAAGWVLFVLGGYLAMAGHRSHLYQSANEQTAFLLEEIRRIQAKG
jgi:hypothetical protein